jgi:transcription termination/antitermination protein NusG
LASQESETHQDHPVAEWYAAYVKHHHERKVADLLERKGLEVFLPQQKAVHRWKDRNKTLFLPLFPGYLFLETTLEDKFQILNTPGVFFLVENGGRACPISRQEIESIRRVVEVGAQVQAHPYVSTGDRVMIRSGPLSGVTGILTRFKNQYRVVLTVELLEKAVSIEVEIGNVERIHGPDRGHNLAAGS